MSFHPYLRFDGSCENAMRWYCAIFDGRDLQIMKFADAPPEMGMDGIDRVMHAQFFLPDGGRLMASDTPPGQETGPQRSVSVSHFAASVEDARTKYDRLADGGEPVMPFGETFFSKGFGMVKDQFGTHWMIMAPEQPMPG